MEETLPDLVWRGRCPGEQLTQHGTEGLPPCGEVGLHPRPHVDMDVTCDHAISLKLAELLNQHLLRDAGDGPLKLGKPAGVRVK